MFLIFKHVLSSVKLYPASCISPSTEDRAKRSSSLIITETQFTTMESNETTHVSHQNGRIWKHWYYQLLAELSEVKDSYVRVDITLRSHSGDQTGRICEIKNLFALRHSKLLLNIYPRDILKNLIRETDENAFPDLLCDNGSWYSPQGPIRKIITIVGAE